MFQKASELTFRYKAASFAFIVVVAIKFSLQFAENYNYMDIINVVLYSILFLLVCFGYWDFNKKKKENQE